MSSAAYGLGLLVGFLFAAWIIYKLVSWVVWKVRRRFGGVGK